MTVKDLFLYIRYQLNDFNEVKITDAELFYVLNEVLSMCNKALSEINSYIVQKEIPITLVDNECDLPNDFNGIIEILNGEDSANYSLIGNKIKSDGATSMTYKYCFAKLSNLTDTIPLPMNMEELVKKYFRMFVMNELPAVQLQQVINQELASFMSGLEYVELSLPMPFEL